MVALIGEICGNIRLRTHDAVERKPLAQTHGRFLALLIFKQLTGQLLLQCCFLFLFGSSETLLMCTRRAAISRNSLATSISAACIS